MKRDHNTLEILAIIICYFFCISKKELFVANKHIPSDARGCFFYLCKKYKISNHHYVSLFLETNPSKVHHSINSFENRIGTNPKKDKMLRNISLVFESGDHFRLVMPISSLFSPARP